jgi:hypothetical protein
MIELSVIVVGEAVVIVSVEGDAAVEVSQTVVGSDVLEEVETVGSISELVIGIELVIGSVVSS